MQIKIGKTVRFEAAHGLCNNNMSTAENQELYGECCPWKEDGTYQPHGHSYKVKLVIKGEVDSATGFLMNFKDLKHIIKTNILDKLDHKLLNKVIPDKYHPTTVENMLTYIVDGTDIKQDIILTTNHRCVLHSIKIWETEDSYAKISLKD